MGFWRTDVIQPGMERDTDAALAEQRTILSMEPKNSRAHFALGTLYHFKGLTEKAIASFLEAIACDSAYAAPHVSLGRIYAVQGRYDLAWRHAREAERLGDGCLLEQLRRYPNAISPGDSRRIYENDEL
jgi:tetratricopeptide (TPR) repeat protein